eukprot:6469621-Amphidinium_carterae.1
MADVCLKLLTSRFACRCLFVSDQANSGRWIAEPALWCHWVHVGSLEELCQSTFPTEASVLPSES